MKRYALIALALLALVGCGSKKDNRGARIPPPNNGGNVGQPITNRVANHVYDSVNDAVFTERIMKFMATASNQEYMEIDIGTVKANTEHPEEGLQIALDLGVPLASDWSTVDPANIRLEMTIYDSLVHTDGLDPLQFAFGRGIAEMVGTSLTYDEASGDLEIDFEDIYGSVWLKGNLSNNTFVGRMFFQNTHNDYGDALGNFSIPRCAIFSDGCP